ncbi:GHKL domain-containing protein [Leptolyngbya sp. NK1-12]|uniref:histidine kinase n=1 Tax=Leptolyngbya sp. NK1-12 TaxID=2547451 RepID=A0AA96WFI7_9CYAN|nr:GHKL domain-containing protein [Leptolyngbya sp. NK1-12]
MHLTDDEDQLRQLEKTVRILQKKLERSEADRRQLEQASELRELLLKAVIREREESQLALEQRSHELETALENLKTLQLKLVESEKMSALGVLVAGIAHEINNPVSFIYGNIGFAEAYFRDLLELLQLYQQQYPYPTAVIQARQNAIDFNFVTADLNKLLSSMRIGAERIYEIVRSLRIFSRLDESEYKAVNIHEGIDSTLVILNNRLKPNAACPTGIQVICEYGELPFVQCFPGLLNQVFMNILVNAIDALEENSSNCQSQPRIRIQTTQVGDKITIRITDNGPGISEALRSKLFDPFFTTKEIGKGTGLGLAISRQIIVEKHHGSLEVESTPGQGATFVITLPINNQADSG